MSKLKRKEYEALLEPLQALALYDTELVPTLDWPADRRAAGRERLRTLGLRGRPPPMAAPPWIYRMCCC